MVLSVPLSELSLPVAGDGLPENGEEAVHWFRQAAARGVISSMYLLGECLLEGVGTAQDTCAAYGWFSAAGELGHRSARERILSGYLTPGAEMSAWNEWMSARYINAAGRRASEWVVE